jgi:uncharacterized membrane protein YphA (DoxX/SURF4 family)
MHRVKVICRLALAVVWIYEGIVPKLLFLRADQVDLVQRSGLSWNAPETTLQVLGIAQAIVGVWLLVGWAEKAAVLTATASMCVLIVLVARGNPSMLTDPYGALIKDACLIACGCAVWMLSPQREAG